MQFRFFVSALCKIDGTTYEHDVVIDRGKISKRKKKPSRNSVRLRAYAVSVKEDIPGNAASSSSHGTTADYR